MSGFLRPLAACLAMLAAGFASFASARDATPEPAGVSLSQEVRQALPPRPALWKVADKDTTIFLFGTIHVLPKGIDWFDGTIANAFAASDTLVTEVADNDPATMQGLVVKLAMLPESRTLREQLTPEQRTQYEKALAEYHMPAEIFVRFEPWYVAVALSTIPLMQEGFSAEDGVEDQLDRLARERGIAHNGLETAAYQLGLFDGLPDTAQERYLAEVIDQLPTIGDQIATMVSAWRQGKAEELARIMNAQESDPVPCQDIADGSQS